MKAELYPKDPNGLDFTYESPTNVKLWLSKNVNNLLKNFRKIIFKGRSAVEFADLLLDSDPIAVRLVNSRKIHVVW